MDGLDKLSHALYGRPAKTEDYEGGGDMRMLHDAARVITALRANLKDAYDELHKQRPVVKAVYNHAVWKQVDADRAQP